MSEFANLSPELHEHYTNMQDDLYDGLKEEVVEATRKALAWGESPANVLNYGLVAAMDIVGRDFGAGILWVPEVLRAANAMKAAMEILRPLLTETGAPKIGIAVIGTVKGDIHDIGKNLVGMMWEGAGFEVHNLGINVDADKFIAAIREHNADILGMSALLTTTMANMENSVKAIKEKYPDIKVLIGGAPITLDFCKRIGADFYSPTPNDAVVFLNQCLAGR